MKERCVSVAPLYHLGGKFAKRLVERDGVRQRVCLPFYFLRNTPKCQHFRAPKTAKATGILRGGRFPPFSAPGKYKSLFLHLMILVHMLVHL